MRRRGETRDVLESHRVAGGHAATRETAHVAREGLRRSELLVDEARGGLSSIAVWIAGVAEKLLNRRQIAVRRSHTRRRMFAQHFIDERARHGARDLAALAALDNIRRGDDAELAVALKSPPRSAVLALVSEAHCAATSQLLRSLSR